MKTRGLLVKKLTINLFTLVFTKEIPGNEKSKKFYTCNFVYVDYDIEVFLYLYQRSFKLQSFCNKFLHFNSVLDKILYFTRG